VLIEATVKVARSLGMNTVAEGIETPQQAAVVSAMAATRAGLFVQPPAARRRYRGVAGRG
jgi:EAL domain-containing protein (putative c-di-GMP-specific phosphodiesterase class I)